MVKDDIYERPEELVTNDSGIISPKIIEKPWGREELIAYTDKYVMKLLVVNPGERLSVQYHKEKLETLYVVQGKGYLFIGPNPDNVEKQPFEKGQSVHITPGTVHTFEATTEMRLLEASTPEVWDVVRVQDRYGRES